MNIGEILKAVIDKGASDLHFSVDMPPVLRLYGDLLIMDEFDAITSSEMKSMIYSVLSDSQKKRFEEDMDLDTSLDFPGIGRFRLNVFMAQKNIGASFRIIQSNIKPIEEIGLPEIVSKFCLRRTGLILVTGPTGSGKSTTLAAMIDYINSHRSCRIITIEDPIEYLYQNKKSMIFQREVFEDTKSFASAVRQSLRQDPNVICVGEMRDLETVATVITAAETGHLVFSTLHTPNTIETINRIIDIFPQHQQEQVRIQLAACLEAVVAQRLLPRKDQPGRIIATEVLVVNSAVRNLIRTRNIEQIYSILQTGSGMDMFEMDRTIMDLYTKGIISRDTALGELREKQNRERLEKMEDIS